MPDDDNLNNVQATVKSKNHRDVSCRASPRIIVMFLEPASRPWGVLRNDLDGLGAFSGPILAVFLRNEQAGEESEMNKHSNLALAGVGRQTPRTKHFQHLRL